MTDKRRIPRRVLIIAAAAGALAVAGCGGDDSQDFVKSYNDAVAPLQQLTATLQTSTSANLSDETSVDAAERDLRRVADEFEAVGGRLRALDAPSGAQDELDRFLASLDGNSGQIRQIARAVKSRDPEKLTTAAAEFATQGTELVEAETALRNAVQ
jgi:hypothetical protein